MVKGAEGRGLKKLKCRRVEEQLTGQEVWLTEFFHDEDQENDHWM